MNVKPIGFVARLGDNAGFIVRIERYGSGRKLPAPRILLDTSGTTPRPFRSALRAMEALELFKASPRAVKQADASTVEAITAPAPVREPRAAAPRPKSTCRTALSRPAPPPPAERRCNPFVDAKAAQRAETEALIRKARYGKAKIKVTRYGECVRDNLNPRRGGILPAHLDPRALVDHEDIHRTA